MKTIAFYNLKGGVGKTASAVNIAHLAADSRLHTLLWDLDPQGAASWYLAPPDVDTHSAKKLLKRKLPPGEFAVKTRYDRLTIIPADFSYRRFDLAVQRFDQDRTGLKRFIEPFGEHHSLAILDCPPSLSNLAEEVFAAADAVFVPLVPTHLSVRAFQQVREFMKGRKLGHKQLYPFFTMVDLRRNLHSAMVDKPPDDLKRLLPTYIPYSSMIEKMGARRAPVTAFASSHPAGKAYRRLWEDMLELLI